MELTDRGGYQPVEVTGGEKIRKMLRGGAFRMLIRVARNMTGVVFQSGNAGERKGK